MIRRGVPVLAAVGLVVMAGAAHAAGAGPFGVGLPEAAVPTGGVFGWIAQQQSGFYRLLTASIRTMQSDPRAGLTLAGLSFLYGVLHAVGPGHGKAVISAYVVANGETLRRGIVLSFASAFAQAVTATVLIGVTTQALGLIARLTGLPLANLNSVEITDAAFVMELMSGATIAALGLFLFARMLRRRPAAAPAPAEICAAPGRPGLRYKGQVVVAERCADCGGTHMPDPAMLAGRLSPRRAWAAIAAVGLRPCTGALIVLTFAFSLKMWSAGILSVLAMATGTGLTVAGLATLAVTARGTALRIAGADSRAGRRMLRAAEAVAAIVILAVGIAILGAGLVGHATAG